MKKLTIIRHAKSSWKYDIGDLDRPLKSRGIADVKVVSKYFKTKYLQPEIVFSSLAKRALETCKIFLENIEFSYTNVNVSTEIYDFSGEKLTNFIKTLDNNYDNVMLFGHNYALTNFVNTYGDRYIENLPTSGLVIFEFNIDSWKDLKPGKIVELVIPKSLRS